MKIIKDFIKSIQALSDSKGAIMIKLLQRRVLCVCKIEDAVGPARSRMSKHLEIVKHAGLITFSEKWLLIDCHFADGAKNPHIVNLPGNLRHWLGENPKVEAMVARSPEISRETICRG